MIGDSRMQVSDYIVEFFINNNITDVFGYPGGMVTYLMDSFDKYSDKIKAHVNYHEQASSFCACGYSQSGIVPGVAYATSGPGATNLVTGIANAFFDSIPCIFITGQVNTREAKQKLTVRQKGFQETDIISIVSSITKYAKYIDDPNMIKYELEKAYYICSNSRPGPVLLDIPIDVFRSNIDINNIKSYNKPNDDKHNSNHNFSDAINVILNEINLAKKPVLLLGNGINISKTKESIKQFVNNIKIPVVTSMIAVDILDKHCDYNFGFIGAYGNRVANFILSQSDLIVSLGSRLDCRQTGSDLKMFDNHKIIRIDIDENELKNKINHRELSFNLDLKKFIPYLDNISSNNILDKFEWLNKCKSIKSKLENIDDQEYNNIIKNISRVIPDNCVITTDVGQNQVWVAQSFETKPNQTILFSGGHGAMGYALPASIGAYFATNQPVFCFTGDGGIQMNIQELQFIKRENLPIKIILINNKSLGMIRHFQEMYFNSNYTQTVSQKGYLSPDFKKISESYGIDYIKIDCEQNIDLIKSLIVNKSACFIEIELNYNTYVFPKLAIGKPIYNQDPGLDDNTLSELLAILN